MIALIANRIITAAASKGTPGRLPGSPYIIAVDGPPGAGKTTFARALTEHINNLPPSGGIELVAQRVKTDWALKIAPQSLSAQALEELLGKEETSSPSFWYDFPKIQDFMDAIGHMYLGGARSLHGIYKAGDFNFRRTTVFPANTINFLVFEGCYALHSALNTGDYSGIFMWSDNSQRKAQFMQRSLERGRSPETAKLLFRLTSNCYARYLKEEIDVAGLWHRLFVGEAGDYHLSYNGNTDNFPFFFERATEITA